MFETVAERWLYAGLEPKHTPFLHMERWRFLDSTRALRHGERVIFATNQRPASGDRMQVTVAANRVHRSSRFIARPAAKAAAQMERDFSDFRRSRWISGPMLLLPDALPFADMAWHGTFGRGRLQTDSVHEVTELLGMRVVLDGHRTRTADRDTVVEGRRLWFVRERSAIRYTERRIDRERTLDTLVTLDRGGTGTLEGWVLFDATSGLAQWRADSLRIVGSAAWRYPDGRVFQTPLRMERWRELQYMSARDYDVRDSTRAANSARRSAGMVIFWDSTEARLARAAPGVLDSVERAWRTAPSAEEAERIWRQLSMSVDRPTKRRLAAVREATGDTAFVLEQRKRVDWESPLDSVQMSRRIAIMANPGAAVRVGVEDDSFYEDIAQLMVARPPALMSDTTQWPCTPAACRLLATQDRSAREPRLRDVALVAHLVLDPSGWSDRVLTQPDRPLLVKARWLARGVGATWLAASHAPLPPVGADALSWLEWMNGVSAAYAPLQQPFAPESSVQSRLRFEATHANAIRFITARTGRDVTAELRRKYATAIGDTARTVFGFLVSRLTGLDMTAADIASALRTGSTADRVLATEELHRLMGRTRGTLTPVDSATRQHVYDALLIAERHEGASPWPTLGNSGSSALMLELHLSDSTRFVLADTLPASTVSRWADSAHFITRAQWNARGNRRGGSLATFTIDGALGPFVAVTIHVIGRAPRQSDDPPYGWESGASFVLLEVDGCLVAITVDQWIT